MLVPARLVLRRTARTHSALMSVSPLAARALRWAFRLTPAALEPQPCATHSRPKVRRPRPPRPDTTAARLRALSSARTDSGWTRMAGPAETRRLAAGGERPPAAKASRPAPHTTSDPAGTQPARASLDFASFGTVMKDAKRAEAQRAVIYSAAPTHRHPLTQDPRLRLHCT